MVKDVTYIDWVKKDLFGCFRIEEIRDKDNETGLKEEGVIEMSTLQCFPYTRLHSLSSLKYLPFSNQRPFTPSVSHFHTVPTMLQITGIRYP